MLKHFLLALLLAAIVYTVAPSAIAQDSGNSDPQSAPAGPPPENRPGHAHMDPAKRTEMLTKKLSLTSDQQAKVLDILKSEQSQMESLHSDSSVPAADRHSKMMDIHKASDDQIRSLLNPEQQKKWEMMQSRHDQWQGNHPMGQGPPDSSEPK